jgi:hypothetical protein
MVSSVGRVAFLLLVLANLLYFVWAAGYLGGGREGREPERLSAQLQPDRLQAVVRGDKTAAQSGAPDPKPVAKPSTGIDAGVQAQAAPVASSEAAETVCRRIGPIAKTDADRLAAVFKDKDGKVSGDIATDGSNYWVYIPAGDASKDKAVAELKQAGVTEFFFAAEGPNKGAISLGVFHREQAAKDLLQRLIKKGIKSVKIDVKPRKTDKVALDVRAPANLIEAEIAGRNYPTAACPAE